MNNGMNFFSWIRDGVRQSVLMGVSDAVEQLGTPADATNAHPSVAGFLRTEASASATPKLTSSTSTGTRSRKRLGKSLKDFGSGDQ